MAKNCYTESQIRQLVEKIAYVAQKNHGVIKINKLDEAGTFAAYLAGFSSWQQYRLSQKQKKLKSAYEVQLPAIPAFTAEHVDISSPEILLWKRSLQQRPKEQPMTTQLQENRQIISSLVIGHSANALLKSKDTVLLNLQDTLFVGNDKSFLQSVEQQIDQQDQCCICISSVTDMPGLMQPQIDPLKDIHGSEYFEKIFHIKPHDDKDFGFWWSILVKQLVQLYYLKIDTAFLLETLALDFLLKLWMVLQADNHFLANFLGTYIKALPGLHFNSNQVYLSQTTRETHWKNTYALRHQLQILDKAYQDGIFSTKAPGLLECMLSKKSINIVLPEKIDAFMANLVNMILEQATQEYHQHVQNRSLKHYNVFLLNYHQDIFKQTSASSYVTYLCHALPHQNGLLPQFAQVVFSRHEVMHDLPSEFINKFYLQTRKITDNIFAHGARLLLELAEHQGYVWQPLDTSKTTYMDEYVLSAIQKA